MTDFINGIATLVASFVFVMLALSIVSHYTEPDNRTDNDEENQGEN